MHPATYCAQTIGTVVHGIEGGHNGEQCLSSTNVAGGLFSADMLLARLHCHAQGLVATPVNRYADDATRDRAFVGIASRKKRCMRATEAHRHAKALTVSDYHIDPLCAGWFDHR